MSETSDGWERGDPYEHYIGRWSRRIAPRFLSWLGMPPGLRWLDVGCGTGALCTEILEHWRPQAVAGVEPSDGFRATAGERLLDRAALMSGSAAAIPLDASSVDVVVSGLVLNFVPDHHRALEEMSRVARRGGTIAAYVWDYPGKMEIIGSFWDAAVKLDRDAGKLDERARFAACTPDQLRSVFGQAGFANIRTTGIEIRARFDGFDDYWQPFLGGQGPAPAYAMSLSESARNELRTELVRCLPMRADGSLELTARAWAVRGETT